MERYDANTLRAALLRVWPDPATGGTAQIRELTGGLNRRTFLAVAGGRGYALRMPAPSNAGQLDLATEVRAMRAAAAAGLAPAVVGVDVAAGILLTEWRMMPLTPESTRYPAMVSHIAAHLRLLHAVAVELPAFSAVRVASDYLEALRSGRRPGLSSAERSWADELRVLARRYDARYAPTVFCHNDLVATNVLGDGAGLLFIDFEYAVRGAPILDLASLAGMNGYAQVQRRELLAAYYGDSAAVSLTELDDAVRMVRLMAYFWARLGAQRAEDSAAPYVELAAELQATLK